MSNRLRGIRTVTLAAIVTIACAAVANAQDVATASQPANMLTANPFTLMYKWFNADYERRFGSNATWGTSGSVFSLDDFSYKNANVSLKYYPRASMDGFYLGGRTGIYHVSGGVESANFYGAGFEIGYNWLLGRRQNVAIGLGAGVTRLFGGELAGASLAVPTLRLVNVGIVF